MKKVLVTGAAGFIGRCTLQALKSDGYDVHAVSHNRGPLPEHDVSWHQADLLEKSQAAAVVTKVHPDYLLHLSWFAEPEEFWTSLENLRWVKASLDLVEIFAAQGGKRVVIAGTCAEYDWRYGYCVEKMTPTEPTTLYGSSKYALYLMVKALAKQTGISAAWGRIFFLYGPHENKKRLVASVINSLLEGRPAKCSQANQMRDFLHVEDVAGAFVALLGSDITGPVNIASGRPVRLKEVLSKICELIGADNDLLEFGAIPARADDPPLLVANVSRLNHEVGWKSAYDLDAGLRQTIDWWKRQASIKP